MNMKKIFASIALCGVLALVPAAFSGSHGGYAALAQNDVTVSGTVVDENGEPILGAGVVVKGTTTGTTADLDGVFSLTVPAGSVLQFISVGFETVEKTVNVGGDLGTITMPTEHTVLDQVVVIGYGSQKKVDLTGSVAIVDADEMKKVSHSNISTMLEGKVAGVQITSDGQPGADPSVRIRGLGSFGSTAPLYVIDGVPMGTTIRDFSPNDIETIQVLKDASAAAIYGSRAANGVVIITTKGGKKNQPIMVDYTGYVGVDKIRKNVYKVMDSAQYGDFVRMAFDNSGLAVPGGYDPASSLYVDPKQVNTDWFDAVFKTGIRQNHNVNLSGGGENSTFNIALDYFNQKGTMVGAGPNYDRFTVRANNTMDIKFLKLRTGLVYSHSSQDSMSLSNANEYVQGLYGTQYPVMASALLMPPSIKAYDESTWFLDRDIAAAGEYSYDSWGFGTYYDNVHGDIRMTNPLLYNNLLERNTIVDRIVATGSATVDLLDMVGAKNQNHKLDYTLNLSYSKTNCKDFTFVPSFIQSTTNYLSKSNERLSQGYRAYSDFLVENYLTYDGKFGNHHLNLVGGMTFERELSYNLSAWGNNMPEPYYLQIGNATDRDASSSQFEHVLASYIGRLTYDYDSRYLFQATVRRDGSSRLSTGNHWDWFPSASIGWRIDKEPFFTVDPQLVSLLKLRASYGVLGNENIGEYQYMDTMARGNYTYSFGGNKVTGSSISNYVNTAIHWEKKKTLDIGLDFAMFGGAFELNADYYNALSEDLLYSVPVPAEAGATNESVTMNAASMRNTGIELSASWRNYQHDFKYEFSGNVTFPKNTVVSLGPSGEARNDAFTRTELGAEVGRFYGYVYEGIFQNQEEIDNRVNDKGQYVVQAGAQPGDVAYKDINNDGQITADDQTFIGSGMSKVQFGLSARFEYKGFDLSISTFGAAGYQLLDFVDMTLRSSYGMTNRSVDLMKAWTPQNPSTTIPRVYYKATGTITNDMFSSRYLQNGSYWKIANVEFGYNFPEGLFNGFIRGARIYASGQNLLTISKYRGYNIDFAGGAFTPGYNYCSYPAPITAMLGVKLSF
uniref:Outer membrane protein n=1 Tax=uncultured bacterium URE4 TaxID=581112 RepID=C0K011_9BACT|nr:outer membrane protein [uncultured bacterium URE4]